MRTADVFTENLQHLLTMSRKIEKIEETVKF